MKIGVVTARFNWSVTKLLEQGALDALAKADLSDEHIVKIRVAGAIEIPLAVKWLFENGCDGVVALGAVIRGETAHFDYVCNSVERGCSQLQLEYSRPIGFGVITTEDSDQAFARCGGAKGNKGAEAADVTLEMLQLKNQLISN